MQSRYSLTEHGAELLAQHEARRSLPAWRAVCARLTQDWRSSQARKVVVQLAVDKVATRRAAAHQRRKAAK